MNSNSSIVHQTVPSIENVQTPSYVVAICVVAVVGGIMVILLLVFVVCFNKPGKKEDISALESFNEETEVLRDNSVAMNDIAPPCEEVQLNTYRKPRPQSSPSIFSREEFYKEVLQLHIENKTDLTENSEEVGNRKDVEKMNGATDCKVQNLKHPALDVEIRITDESHITQETDDKPVATNISALGLKIRKRKASMAALRESFNSKASNGDAESLQEVAEENICKDEVHNNGILDNANKAIIIRKENIKEVDDTVETIQSSSDNILLPNTVVEEVSVKEMEHSSFDNRKQNFPPSINSDEDFEKSDNVRSDSASSPPTCTTLHHLSLVIPSKKIPISNHNIYNHSHFSAQNIPVTPHRPVSVSNLKPISSTKLPSTPLSSNSTYSSVYETNTELGGGGVRLTLPEENVQQKDVEEVDVGKGTGNSDY